MNSRRLMPNTVFPSAVGPPHVPSAVGPPHVPSAGGPPHVRRNTKEVGKAAGGSGAQGESCFLLRQVTLIGDIIFAMFTRLRDS